MVIDKPLLLSGNVWYDMVIQMHNVSELMALLLGGYIGDQCTVAFT